MARTRAPWAAWHPSRYNGSRVTGKNRLITLHTMEVVGWPGYGGGASQPHLSVNPANGQARQHVLFNRSARALASPGSPHSPNMNLGINIQIEIAGYAAKTDEYGDQWYEQLGQWVNWLCDEWDVPERFPFDWGESGTAGPHGRNRVSWSRMAGVSGIVAHQNHPFNEHWDVGAMNQQKLLRAMGAVTTQARRTPRPDPGSEAPHRDSWTVKRGDTLAEIAEEVHMDWHHLARINGISNPRELKIGQVLRLRGPAVQRRSQRTKDVYVNVLHYGTKDSDSVRHVQRRLIDLGYSIPAGATGNWFGQTQRAVRKLQHDWHQAPQYATGRSLGPRQTRRLFRGVNGVRIHT